MFLLISVILLLLLYDVPVDVCIATDDQALVTSCPLSMIIREI